MRPDEGSLQGICGQHCAQRWWSIGAGGRLRSLCLGAFSCEGTGVLPCASSYVCFHTRLGAIRVSEVPN